MTGANIRYLFLLFLFVVSPFVSVANADCQHGLDLEGTISIQGCDPNEQECISGKSALYEYSDKLEDTDEVLTVSLASSPWRFYGPDRRILRAPDLAEMLKPHIKDKNVQKIEIYSSWSGVKPHGKEKSLAEELSEQFNGISVTAIEGFLWFKSNGDYYTTSQSFTIGGHFPYSIKVGDDVMESLTDGAFVMAQDYFIKQKDAVGLNYAAVGWDTYMLCPDKALQTFELAAELNYPIAAYNAAVMRLERGEEGDFERASQLLEQAAEAGDKKAKSLLLEISSK